MYLIYKYFKSSADMRTKQKQNNKKENHKKKQQTVLVGTRKRIEHINYFYYISGI